MQSDALPFDVIKIEFFGSICLSVWLQSLS